MSEGSTIKFLVSTYQVQKKVSGEISEGGSAQSRFVTLEDARQYIQDKLTASPAVTFMIYKAVEVVKSTTPTLDIKPIA
jgi:hypothetical protein